MTTPHEDIAQPIVCDQPQPTEPGFYIYNWQHGGFVLCDLTRGDDGTVDVKWLIGRSGDAPNLPRWSRKLNLVTGAKP